MNQRHTSGTKTVSQAANRIWANLLQLGGRRLAIMAIAAMATMGTVGLSAWFLAQPTFETLYVGLARDDINRIGPALSEAGIGYDVSSDGTSVLVQAGQAARARSILAERGLPRSSGSGYELFDNLGSLGLTSFMQEVTRVRALEGEIARSVRSIEGIQGARVHIVQPDRSSFSARNRQASASVLIQSNGRDIDRVAKAVRHLVAAAVPQLAVGNVTVLDSSGQVLASGDEPASSTADGALGMQRLVENRLSENIARVLTPQLGASNFRVAVHAVLDTDQRTTSETIYDPESRVERSIKVVRTQDTDTSSQGGQTTTVEQDIPEEQPAQANAGPSSNRESERREETTNYEMSSKRISSVRNGYSVSKLTASVVVNASALGAEPAVRLEALRASTQAAAGVDAGRGDVIDVSAVEFVTAADLAATTSSPLLLQATAQLGSVVKALAFLIALVLVLRFAIKPLVAAAASALSPPQSVEGEGAIAGPSNNTRLAGPMGPPPSAADRLAALVDQDSERAAEVLRSWVRAGEERLAKREAA
ncbi:flagellar M-ring protein FliF [Ahrensia sp. R2A130]|nr:flagellar M-ring protein FliF [Ahrensia sp. R2A130]